MDLDTLKLFEEVMRERSFARVARSRLLAPSSVSRSIAALEQELGLRLFQRSTRKLEPTEAGLFYFERIAPLIAELESAQQQAADMSREPQGLLRIALPSVFGLHHVVPKLENFYARYPRLRLELILSDAIQDLIEDRIDIAVRLGTLADSSYIAQRLCHMRFHVCASPVYLGKHGRPKIPAELREHNCLLFPRPGFNLNWLFKDSSGRVYEQKIHGNLLITNSAAIRECLLKDMGISLLPDWLVRQDIEQGLLIDLYPDYEVTATEFDNAIWLLYPSREYLPLKVRAFMKFLSAAFPNNLIEGR